MYACSVDYISSKAITHEFTALSDSSNAAQMEAHGNSEEKCSPVAEHAQMTYLV